LSETYAPVVVVAKAKWLVGYHFKLVLLVVILGRDRGAPRLLAVVDSDAVEVVQVLEQTKEIKCDIQA